jgi:hypothetical protein
MVTQREEQERRLAERREWDAELEESAREVRGAVVRRNTAIRAAFRHHGYTLRRLAELTALSREGVAKVLRMRVPIGDDQR